MKDTVLITGGLGYVGGRIAQKLSESSDYLIRLGTRKLNVEQPQWIRNASIVNMDLSSDADLDAACKDARYVVHLASVNEIDSAVDPEQSIIINSLGTLKLIRAAERAGIEKFLYFSTAHIYGAPLVGKITENTLPRPVHPYAITHRTAEDFILAAHDRKAFTGIVLRLSNSLGAPAHPKVNRWMLVANDLCMQAVTVKKLVLKSSGIQRRDFITLSDVGRAVLHLLKLTTSQCYNGTFNLGGENPIRIKDLALFIADRCKDIFGFIPPIVCPEPRINEVSENLEYRIDKLKKTSFSLQSNFTEEIDSTLKFCKQFFGSI